MLKDKYDWEESKSPAESPMLYFTAKDMPAYLLREYMNPTCGANAKLQASSVNLKMPISVALSMYIVPTPSPMNGFRSSPGFKK